MPAHMVENARPLPWPHACIVSDEHDDGGALMGGSGVIDNFLGTFTRYIDSGFEDRRV